MKTCNVCKQQKFIDDFHRDKSRKDNHCSTCKICAVERTKAAYKADPEKGKLRVREWVEKNRARHNEKCARWVKNNKATVNARTARRYASRKNATPAFVEENVDFMWMIQQAYELAKLRTKTTGIIWEVDHEIPLRGKFVSGLHTPWNLRVVPRAENRRKSNTFHVN
jgi:hypothetical protein